MTIRKSIRVERPPEVVFRVFTEEIGKWWPLKEGFSFGGEKAKDIFIEGRVGGRFFERFTDGTEFEVGPHHRVSAAARRKVHLEGSRLGGADRGRG